MWHEPLTTGHPEDICSYLTLNEISEQFPNKVIGCKIITVITDEPLRGEIFQYGNHGEFWEKIGEHQGYA